MQPAASRGSPPHWPHCPEGREEGRQGQEISQWKDIISRIVFAVPFSMCLYQRWMLGFEKLASFVKLVFLPG